MRLKTKAFDRILGRLCDRPDLGKRLHVCGRKERKVEPFIAFLEEKEKALQRNEQTLAESDRKDEANMAKIQMNIYGICRTVFEAVLRQYEAGAVKAAYLQKTEQLRDAWKSSLDKAKAHDDVEKSIVEELKLEALEDVRSAFLRIGEGGQNG